jgi:uncharacterized protein
MRDHLPIIDEESRPFWDGLGEQRFLLKYCTDCGKPHFFPRTYCPYCWGETEWRDSPGRATVYAATTIRSMGAEPFAARVPYNLSVVQLDEGPLMLTNVTGVDPESVKIGMAVKLKATLDEDVWLPWFEPA